MSYKELVLTCDQIMEQASAFADPETLRNEEKGNGIHFSFRKEGKPCLLVAYRTKRGLMTLNYGQGTNPAISQQLADIIVESISKPKTKNVHITIEDCNKDSLVELSDYLVSKHGASLEEEKEQNHATIWTLKGINGDRLTLTLFTTTNKLFLQGRPAFLIVHAISYIGTWDRITDAQHVDYINKIFNIECALQDLKDRAHTDYPHLYDFADTPMKKILNTAIQIQQSGITYEDPCILLFSPLRAMECFVKKLLHLKGITVTSEPFRSYFIKNSTKSTHSLKPEYVTIINQDKYCNAINECFSFYSANRHSIFHGSGVPGLTKILSDATARSIAQQALCLMESHCIKLEKHHE